MSIGFHPAFRHVEISARSSNVNGLRLKAHPYVLAAMLLRSYDTAIVPPVAVEVWG